MNALTSTRTNSPSFGMAAKVNQEVLNAIKNKPGKQISRVLNQVQKVHSASNAADCDVTFTLKQFVKKAQGKSKKPAADPIIKVIAKVTSKSDNDLAGVPISVKLDKLGSFFNGFFGKVNKSINEVSNRQEDIVSLSKFK